MTFIDYLKKADIELWKQVATYAPYTPEMSFIVESERAVRTGLFFKQRGCDGSFSTKILMHLAAWAILYVPGRDRVLFFTKEPDRLEAEWGGRSGVIKPAFGIDNNSVLIHRGLTRHANWPGLSRIERATLVIYDDAGPAKTAEAVEHYRAAVRISRLPLLGGHSAKCPVIAVLNSFPGD